MTMTGSVIVCAGVNVGPRRELRDLSQLASQPDD